MGLEQDVTYNRILEWGFWGAALVIASQAYHYLKHGEWPAISVIDALLYVYQRDPLAWLLYPEDWRGVHKLLDSIPLSLAMAVLGMFLAVAYESMLDQLKKVGSKLRRKKSEEEALSRED